jgi:hypothetical protein
VVTTRIPPADHCLESSYLADTLRVKWYKEFPLFARSHFHCLCGGSVPCLLGFQQEEITSPGSRNVQHYPLCSPCRFESESERPTAVQEQRGGSVLQPMATPAIRRGKAVMEGDISSFFSRT